MTNSAQIPLALPHRVADGRDSFIVSDCNRQALTFLDRWPHWPAPVTVLSGPIGSGKTHVSRIWAQRVGADWIDTAAVGALSGRLGASVPRIVVDDVQPDELDERAFFHLINRIRDSGGALLMVSREPVSAWRIELPDLASRLRLATPLEISMPDEDLIRKLLVKLFADRQLVVDRAVIDYLVVRLPRSFDTLSRTVEQLDKLALATGRRITRPLAAEIVDT